jgi:hypothetical protein
VRVVVMVVWAVGRSVYVCRGGAFPHQLTGNTHTHMRPPPQTNILRLAALEVAAERLAAQQRTPALALSDAVARLEARVAEGEERAVGLEGRVARGREAGEVGGWIGWVDDLFVLGWMVGVLVVVVVIWGLH